MTSGVPTPSHCNVPVGVEQLSLPVLVAAAGERASNRFLEFFDIVICNPNTQRYYVYAVMGFLAWCEEFGVTSITAVQPRHVITWVEGQTSERCASTICQQLAAVRRLFKWLVAGRIMPFNPAAFVRGPANIQSNWKTPVLNVSDVRVLIDSVDISTPIGLRDRALISLMFYSFCRIGQALIMRVGDVFVQNGRLWVRLRDNKKVGKLHEIPCHDTLAVHLRAYLDGVGITGDAEGLLFRSIGRGTNRLTRTPLFPANAHAMIRRRALAAGIETKIGNHSLRATGIIAYLKEGGSLENAAALANHVSTHTTRFYNLRRDDISID